MVGNWMKEGEKEEEKHTLMLVTTFEDLFSFLSPSSQRLVLVRLYLMKCTF